ncbi:MAG: aldehyde ferredoxin oxidoreductase family protein [Anaerolineae bacterium]|nr:aldehyde ferredoxin oxidoreductase family protein [Anaerolineae bacterium]
MSYGYHGKILHVNLTTCAITVEEPDEMFYRKYMGGSAMGAYYLLKNTPPGTDPLAPENTLALMLSVTTGVPISGQSRMTAVARSPISNMVGDSQCGGFWPAELKFAGFDGIVIQGRADSPVYLWVHDGAAELCDAAHLWGRTTYDVQTALEEEVGDKRAQVLQCGPAGEKLVKFAAMINMSNRANGRTGMGAVMGSKNLKAVVVRGKQRPDIHDREALKAITKWGVDHVEDALGSMTLLGTPSVLRGQQSKGGLPTYNYSSGSFDEYQAITGETMRETILKENDTCYACTVRCKRVVEKEEGPYKLDPNYGGPEYETLGTFGSYCGISDLAAVAYANQLCNQYGMDTIACGATIAWAMDCFENEIISIADTGGIELRFGDAEAMTRMVELIARREGFGDVLAEGSAQAAQRFGQPAVDLLITVKGSEMPAHMPQVKRSLALIYAVNPFGADHMSSEHDGSYSAYNPRLAELGLVDPQPTTVLNAEKVRYAFYTQCSYSAMDTLDLCQFVWGPDWQLFGMKQMAELVTAVTGWPVSVFDLQKLGERRINLLRAFNAREGYGRDQDTIPKKLTQPLKGGASDGLFVTVEEVERAKDTYYAMAGWDVASGQPQRAKLEELGIGWVADMLEGA